MSLKRNMPERLGVGCICMIPVQQFGAMYPSVSPSKRFLHVATHFFPVRWPRIIAEIFFSPIARCYPSSILYHVKALGGVVDCINQYLVSLF
jgi:hypothetical protein